MIIVWIGYSQQCASKLALPDKKPNGLVFAHLYGINTPIMGTFKVPTRFNSMMS